MFDQCCFLLFACFVYAVSQRGKIIDAWNTTFKRVFAVSVERRKQCEWSVGTDLPPTQWPKGQKDRTYSKPCPGVEEGGRVCQNASLLGWYILLLSSIYDGWQVSCCSSRELIFCHVGVWVFLLG